MNRIREAVSRVGELVVSPFRALQGWWVDIPDQGQVAFVGLLLIGVGLELGHASLVVPGAVLTVIGMGFSFRRGT